MLHKEHQRNVWELQDRWSKSSQIKILEHGRQEKRGCGGRAKSDGEEIGQVGGTSIISLCRQAGWKANRAKEQMRVGEECWPGEQRQSSTGSICLNGGFHWFMLMPTSLSSSFQTNSFFRIP